MTTTVPTPPAVDATLAETADLTATVPCDWAKCPRPAVWIVRPDCTHPVITCVRHRRRIDDWCNRPHHFVTCKRCGTELPGPIDWRPL